MLQTKIKSFFNKLVRYAVRILNSLAEQFTSAFNKAVKIRFTNFWFEPPQLPPETTFFLKPLLKTFIQAQQKYQIVHYAPADIQFFSVFGRRQVIERSRAKYKIFYTGENVSGNSRVDSYKQYNDYVSDQTRLDQIKLSLGFNFLAKENYLRLPLWLWYFFDPYSSKDKIRHKLKEFWNTNSGKRQKFCALVASHDNKNNLRAEIHNTLSSIGQVDCPGKLLHNDDSLKTVFADNKIIYLRQYKFNICPENSHGNGYVTEKLFQALHAGCIPIYNGYSPDPEPNIINPKVILWFEPNSNNTQTLKQVKELWADEQKYRTFLAQNCFLDTAPEMIHDYLKKYCAALEEIAEKSLKPGHPR
ncbi:putative fucosyltransferase [Candidatus Termititenax aidoneus]|uniref:Fucosyltransferase n=1 Tax=Termititenax aidoneus TaxID=2218524 RepID=A0A388TBA1_TERA1|nr:putative fucosyltransferase [Candidatus Termititenax aidoneus]